MGPGAANEGARAGAAPASTGGVAFVPTGAALACGCGSTVVATATTVAAACDTSGFWAAALASRTGVTGGNSGRRSAWAVAVASSLGLAAGVEASVVESDAGCTSGSVIFVSFSEIASGEPVVLGSLLMPQGWAG